MKMTSLSTLLSTMVYKLSDLTFIKITSSSSYFLPERRATKPMAAGGEWAENAGTRGIGESPEGEFPGWCCKEESRESEKNDFSTP